MRLLGVVVVLAGVAVAGPPPAKLLSPREMMKLLEDSPREYAIDSEPNAFPQWRQQNAMLAWPELHPPAPMPAFEKHQDGSISVVPVSHPNEVDEMLEKVEPMFEGKDYADAEKGYEQILKKFPGDYSVQLGWGDAALFSGRAEVALARYEKATKLNPADHRSWYYRGNALAVLGRKKEAIDAWVRAIAMRPENTTMLTGLETKAAAFGYVLRSRSLLPGARVEPIKDGFRISFSSKEPHWLAWGVCKAMWRGEPVHRKAMTGSEKDTFSILEEKECLANTMAMYENRKKGDASDPMVEQMLAAVKAKVFPGYLVYEIASRIEPHIFLQQAPETQRVVEDYVRKFILVPESP